MDKDKDKDKSPDNFFQTDIFDNPSTIVCGEVIQEAVKDLLANIISEVQVEYRQKAIAAGKCKPGIAPPPITFTARDLSIWVIKYYSKYGDPSTLTDPSDALDPITGEPRVSKKFLEYYHTGALTNIKILGRILKRSPEYFGIEYAGKQNNRYKWFLNKIPK